MITTFFYILEFAHICPGTTAQRTALWKQLASSLNSQNADCYKLRYYGNSGSRTLTPICCYTTDGALYPDYQSLGGYNLLRTLVPVSFYSIQKQSFHIPIRIFIILNPVTPENSSQNCHLDTFYY